MLSSSRTSSPLSRSSSSSSSSSCAEPGQLVDEEVVNLPGACVGDRHNLSKDSYLNASPRRRSHLQATFVDGDGLPGLFHPQD